MPLKITDELLDAARSLTEKGATRDYVYDLYRNQGMSMRRIGENLSELTGNKVTVKYVNALFALHDLKVKTAAEQKKDTARLPTNKDKTKEKVAELEELGFTKDKISDMYFEDNMSKNDLINAINLKAGSEIVYKQWMVRVFEYYGIKQKDHEELNKLRMAKVNSTLTEKRATEAIYGIGVTADEIAELYKSGLSLSDIYREIGVAPVTSSKLIQDRGIRIRRDRKVTDTLEELSKAGFDEARIREEYITKKRNVADLAKVISESFDYSISRTAMTRVLKQYGIVRNPEELAELKTIFATKIFLGNLVKLSRAGFSSLEDLAKHYDENKSLTKHALVRKLNENVRENETPFTERWLGRHMDPLLPADRLKGTSRVEKEFAFEFSNLLDVDEEIHLGSFKIIPPYQLDVYLPNLNLAVEFNGDYWHSDRFMLENHGMTARAYHEMKLARCEELGIRLLFVWESDWLGNRDEVIAALEEVLSNPASEPEILSVLSLDELFEDELAA